jgi:rod shape-determining protein MreD
MSTILPLLPLAFVIVAVQVTIMDHVNMAGAHPDLILVSIILLTLIGSQASAFAFAVILALLADAISGLPLGISVIPYLIVVFLASQGERILFGARLGWPVIATALATLAAGLVTLLELSAIGWEIQWTGTLLRVLGPTVIVNTLLMFLLYVPVEYALGRRKHSFQ